MGRPSSYTAEIGQAICAEIMEGKSLRTICASDERPSCATVYKWLASNKEFVEQYAHAREVQADIYADEIIDISDDGTRDTYIDADGNEKTDHDVIARSRLRVDARKWIASKLKPKKYGEKVQQEVSGKDGEPLTISVRYL